MLLVNVAAALRLLLNAYWTLAAGAALVALLPVPLAESFRQKAAGPDSNHKKACASRQSHHATSRTQVCSAFDGMQRKAVANKAESKAGQAHGMLHARAVGLQLDLMSEHALTVV